MSANPPTAFAASLRREWRLLRGRPWDLAMVSWVPLLALLLMVWIFSAGLVQRLPVAVWDQDHSALSRQLVRMLGATPGLAVQSQALNASEAQWALQSMNAYAVVQIPHGFARDIKRGQGADVVLMHNAQLATHSSLIQRDLRQVVGTLSAGVEMQARAKRGDPAQALRVRMEPIRTNLVSLFNISTNYEQFLAAALIPALLHILGMTAGAWSVGRELRDRTLGQWMAEAAGPGKPGWSAIAGALAGKLALSWASLGLGGTLLALQGVEVLGLAADVVAPGDHFGGLAHGEVDARHLLLEQRVDQVVGIDALHGQADGLDATGDDDVAAAGGDLVGGDGDRLQA